MAVLSSLPRTNQTGANEWSDVETNDEALRLAVNTIDSDQIATGAVTETKIGNGQVTTQKLASPLNSVYRTIFSSKGHLYGTNGAATYMLGSQQNVSSTLYRMAASGTDIATYGGQDSAPDIFYFDDADHTVAGLTQKLRLRVQVAANATAPGINFTFGLYPVTVTGGTDTLRYTAGTVVPSSTQAVNTPAASTITPAVNSDLTIPVDGTYMLCVVTSGSVANNSGVSVHAQLQTRNV